MTDPLAELVELPGVSDAVRACRAAVDRLLAHRVLRGRSADVSAESALRGAWASASLAGATLSLADVRAGATDPITQGALRAHGAIGELADTWTRAPRQALARLHALAAADLVGDRAALGRPARAMAPRVDALVDALTTTSAPAVVIAAVVHGELASLNAFPPVSGLVARAAVRLTLVERGLDPKSLAVVEVGHLEARAEHDAALAGYRAGGPDGVARWLRHCADAVSAGAREALAICEAMQRG
ncbi:MAG: oxidoreductase [Actinomycetia bacterium]|nr:oxidoreductase [Actinomycetes bacterium]